MFGARIERGMMGRVTAIAYRELPDGARVVVPAAQRKERRPDLWRASARLCLADGRLVTVHRFRRTRGRSVEVTASDFFHTQGGMRFRNLVEVVVLGDDRQAPGDGRRGDERIGEADGAMDARAAAVDHQVRPFGHDRFIDRDRVGFACQRQRVSPTGPRLIVGGSQHTQFELPGRDHRHRDPIG